MHVNFFFVCFFYQVCYLCSTFQVLRVTAPHLVAFELGKIFLCHIFIKNSNIVDLFYHLHQPHILSVSDSFDFTPSLDRSRPDQLSDDTQRRYAEEVQAMQASEVARQLEDFR